MIRPARIEEFESVMNFYYKLTDDMQNAKNHPGWIKDVYPERQYINNSIKRGELYVSLEKQEIAGVMVINHEYAEGYDGIKWKINAEKEDICVIHALGIGSDFQGQGLARKMVAYAIDLCKKEGIKSLRLDVLKTNIAPQRLYTSMGFEYLGMVQLFYEDTGLTDYLLYELVL